MQRCGQLGRGCAQVFIDPDGSTHYYKEFEINAINATWVRRYPASFVSLRMRMIHDIGIVAVFQQ